jgi:phosphate transport system permease protein
MAEERDEQAEGDLVDAADVEETDGEELGEEPEEEPEEEAYDDQPARRRLVDRVARTTLLVLTGVAIVPLVLIIYYLVKEGIGAWSWDFFTTDPTGSFLGDPGGIRSAILGTIAMVAIATALAVPVGVGVAIWLVEYGRRSRLALAVRYFIDVMTGVPSIVFGLFVYITLVVTNFGGSSFAAYKGSIALALLMLPVVTRSAEVVLLLVPDSLREAAHALGAPRWKVVFRIVLPTALPGMVTGVLLAIARAAGETAPLLFTATIVNATTFDLGERMNSLPALIFQDVGQAQDRLVQIAWGAALTLVAMVLALTVLARLVQRRSRLS